jgi:hypothetical protein
MSWIRIQLQALSVNTFAVRTDFKKLKSRRVLYATALLLES